MSGNTIRWIVLLVVTAISGATIYHKYETTRPCVTPIPYTIGAVDPRFGISTTGLRASMDAATTIWNEVAGKPLFIYDPEAELTINLIYDEREATAKLGVEITRAQEEADRARASIEAMRAQVTRAENTYNNKVAAINARGGATPSEAAALEKEREYLQSLVSSLNAKVAAFNASIAALNAKVREYNQTAGKTFEEGQYVRDSSGERINIFEFIGTDQLERVLAHEFGHAAGLDHNENENSIMYAKNESGSLTPTEEDIAALKTVCNLQ